MDSLVSYVLGCIHLLLQKKGKDMLSLMKKSGMLALFYAGFSRKGWSLEVRLDTSFASRARALLAARLLSVGAGFSHNGFSCASRRFVSSSERTFLHHTSSKACTRGARWRCSLCRSFVLLRRDLGWLSPRQSFRVFAEQ